MRAFSTHVWNKLKSKIYRDQFIVSQFKRLIPFQITVIRKKAGWSQADLANASGLTQGVISRAEKPDYGNLTVNTILRIAAGFNMGFKGEFVPLSELVKWAENLSEESVRWLPLEKEDRALSDSEPNTDHTITIPTGDLVTVSENVTVRLGSIADSAIRSSPTQITTAEHILETLTVSISPVEKAARGGKPSSAQEWAQELRPAA